MCCGPAATLLGLRAFTPGGLSRDKPDRPTSGQTLACAGEGDGASMSPTLSEESPPAGLVFT